MDAIRRKILLQSLKTLDLLSLVGCFLLTAFVLNAGTGTVAFDELLAVRIKVQNIIIMLGLVAAWRAIFSSFGLYRSKRFSKRHEELIDLAKATATGAILLWLGSVIFTIRLVTPAFVLFFWATATASASIGRLVLRHLLVRARLRGRNLRNLLIVGTNSRATSFAKKVQDRPELGYRVVGFIDEGPGSKAFLKSGYALVAGFEDLRDFLRRNVVDEVVIGLPMRSYYQQSSQIVSMCAEQGIIARFLPDLFDLKHGQIRSDFVDDHAVVTISTGQMSGFPVVFKRALDVCASSLLLLGFSPFFAGIALIIKMTSPGPVIFAQDRVGVSKRRFRLYKFRTMVPDAEMKMQELEHLNEVDGPAFKIKNDPRITPFGRLLRKTSIDELPQLFNVLKGDMSLVGPRPLPVRDFEGFDEDWHRRRFSVRPGITCLWQANGRSNVSFDQWMELDMKYIDEWSLALDLRILLMTIPAVLRGSGAT
jgi:exopolysaccharide biosynthesis polyprenyl glycosylphosphotransferase